MQTVKMAVEYDGTDFSGWQFQKNGRSVQAEIERALSKLLQEEVRVTGAGRTDAGVHARGQVCHFETKSVMDAKSILRGSSALLPQDIVVRSVEFTKQEFHSRFSAKARMYRYYISLAPTAVMRRYRWYVSYALDVSAMQRCASTICGEHDFQSFCKEQAEVKHYRCIVAKAEWKVSGPDLIFEITANRFLHGMVRALVGTMVEVGRGYRSEADFTAICAARNRSEAGMAAPPEGLFLEEVFYE
ncbi:MAG: tRNA pseudouridine(38-40) synthase TruA [Bacteroidota bacterium]